MLATCVANGWDLATYRDPDHPLQRRDAPRRWPSWPASRSRAVAVDGCGAPVMAISLTGLARAFGRLASAARRAPTRPRSPRPSAPTPSTLGGTRRDVTALIRGVHGLIAKDGAEAVYAVGLPDGRGVALKVADGAPAGPRRSSSPPRCAASASRRDVLAELEHAPVLGHGEPVGAVVAVGL